MTAFCITNYDAICNLGNNIDEIFENAISGKDCFLENDNDFIKGKSFYFGKVAPLDVSIQDEAFYTKTNKMLAYLANRMNLSKVIDKYGAENVAVVIATTNSGSEEFSQNHNEKLSQIGNPANFLQNFLGTKNYVSSVSTACTSGSMGIGAAYEAIKNGQQTVMIAGGAEEYHPTQVAVFDTLYATSSKNDAPKFTPSPFDKDRDGLVIGEGAGTLILEEYEHAKARGAKIYAEIVGYATNTDGTHITNPNAETMAIVMQKALEDAKVSADEIGYVNAHGTATLQGDVAESQATAKVFNRQVPVSSIKSYTGHTLGACGAIETILSVKMLQNGWFCPTLNLKNIDSECGELDYITGSGKNIDTNLIMTNNFAFGGINTSLILKKFD